MSGIKKFVRENWLTIVLLAIGFGCIYSARNHGLSPQVIHADGGNHAN